MGKAPVVNTKPTNAGFKDSKPTRTKLPPVNNDIQSAPYTPGVALRCVRQQLGENRIPFNKKEQRESN